jgi:hypothetical protein
MTSAGKAPVRKYASNATTNLRLPQQQKSTKTQSNNDASLLLHSNIAQ